MSLHQGQWKRFSSISSQKLFGWNWNWCHLCRFLRQIFKKFKCPEKSPQAAARATQSWKKSLFESGLEVPNIAGQQKQVYGKKRIGPKFHLRGNSFWTRAVFGLGRHFSLTIPKNRIKMHFLNGPRPTFVSQRSWKRSTRHCHCIIVNCWHGGHFRSRCKTVGTRIFRKQTQILRLNSLFRTFWPR